MASFADEFKAEARANPGDVVRRLVNGWSFCLSYGAVDPIKAVDAAADANLRLNYRGKDVTDEVYEKLKTQEIGASERELLRGEWTLSAKLWPPGRDSTVQDWAYLGAMCFALGAPRAAPESVQTTPNATHFWRWT